MICTPSSDNIIYIYEPLTMFVQQIEQSINMYDLINIKISK